MKKILLILIGVVVLSCFSSVSKADVCNQGEGDFTASFSVFPEPLCVGGLATFTADIANTGTCTDRYQIVTGIQLPNKRLVELMGRTLMTFAPGESVSISITKVIPGFVPPGDYTAGIKVTSIHGAIVKLIPVSVPIDLCP